MNASGANGAALEIDNVTKRFSGLVAVDAMSFALKENEVLGLIGPNGSGKTTMMNLISGALKPSQGKIRLYGRVISGYPADNIARQGVARTFQIVRMLGSLTVLENVMAGGVFGHVRRWGRDYHRHRIELWCSDYEGESLSAQACPDAAFSRPWWQHGNFLMRPSRTFHLFWHPSRAKLR